MQDRYSNHTIVVWSWKMNCKVKLCAFFMSMLFSAYGCGGGGSSNTSNINPETSNQSAPDSKSNASSSNNKPQTPNNRAANKLAINPLIELGLQKGESVCFRLKSYNNTTTSGFSEPACGRIKNEQTLVLSWHNPSDEVVGYYVYFSQNNNQNKFLADVIAI